MFPIRAVEDDHVDRPGVEAQQCVKLTGTNSSIGLIVLIDQCSSPGERSAFVRTMKPKTCSHGEQNVRRIKQANACQLLNLLRFADLVVMAGRLHPFPFRTRP